MLSGNGSAYDINDKLSIGGIIAGEWQYQSLTDAEDFDSERRGALVFQPEFSLDPQHDFSYTRRLKKQCLITLSPESSGAGRRHGTGGSPPCR